ncbi:phage portal protein [Exiguobacterium sp. s5]|uniref:phage portal protein n=1 Tax=Exiguobacterium sp. s5 TaxID=2751239 RepID=UPI001BEC4D0A
MDYQYELDAIRKDGITTDIIKRLIEKHEGRAVEMKRLYERYMQKSVPIQSRDLDDPMKVNNKIANDFMGEIVDTKVGFFAGVPVTYNYEEDTPIVNDAMQAFINRNRVADLDAEVTKWAAITGYGARLLYLDLDGEPRAVNVPPWEVIFLGDLGIDEPEYALRYYTFETADKPKVRAEFYDGTSYATLEGEDAKSLKPLDGVRDHGFEKCPLFGFMNNEELLGDAVKVLDVIDAYDRTLSDVNSEIEAFRSAYLALYGVIPPSEGEDESFATAGTLYLSEGQDAKFVTKVIQDAAVENHLNRLHENIYRLSGTPDLTSEGFASQSSGIAIRLKMTALENKTATFERKFKSATLRMWEVLADYYRLKRIEIDPYKIEMKFTRNLPIDHLYEAQVQAALQGRVPNVYRFGLLSGDHNPSQMVLDYEEEMAGTMPLDTTLVDELP